MTPVDIPDTEPDEDFYGFSLYEYPRRRRWSEDELNRAADLRQRARDLREEFPPVEKPQS